MARKPSLHQISIGNTVRLAEAYFDEWTTLNQIAEQELRDTLFKVEGQVTTRPLEKGTIFKLTAFAGNLMGKPNSTIWRAEKDLENVAPHEIDRLVNKFRRDSYQKPQ